MTESVKNFQQTGGLSSWRTAGSVWGGVGGKRKAKTRGEGSCFMVRLGSSAGQGRWQSCVEKTSLEGDSGLWD